MMEDYPMMFVGSVERMPQDKEQKLQDKEHKPKAQYQFCYQQLCYQQPLDGKKYRLAEVQAKALERRQ
jgi:hypothetical protein